MFLLEIDMRKSLLYAAGILALLGLGCVPRELDQAGEAFSRENYPGTIRMLNLYLNNVQLHEGHERWHEVALFYRGLSKRACLTEQIVRRQRNVRDRLVVSSRHNQDYPFSSEEILQDYGGAAAKPDLIKGIDFHIGMEYLFGLQWRKAKAHFEMFARRCFSQDRKSIQKELGGEDRLMQCYSFSANMVKVLPLGCDKSERNDVVEEAIKLYGDLLYGKSAVHEKFNRGLLMRKYPVRSFRFLSSYLGGMESGYAYLTNTTECGVDFLVFRPSNQNESKKIKDKLENEGFFEWHAVSHSKGVVLESKIGLAIFKGSESLPVLIGSKSSGFKKRLVVLFSPKENAWYCVVYDNKRWKALQKEIKGCM